MLPAEVVGEFHDFLVRLTYGLANRRIAGGSLDTLRPSRGPGLRTGWSRHLSGWRQRRDDPLPLLGIIVGGLEAAANPRPERDVIAHHQSVVDYLPLERQQDRFA